MGVWAVLHVVRPYLPARASSVATISGKSLGVSSSLLSLLPRIKQNIMATDSTEGKFLYCLTVTLPSVANISIDHQAIAKSLVDGLHYSSLPARLIDPNSTFPTELQELVIRHLSTPPTDEVVASLERTSSFWSKSSSLFFDCRASFHRYHTLIYDKDTKTITNLGCKEDGDEVTGMPGVRRLYIYQIITGGYRKGYEETRVSIQARTTNLVIHYDDRAEGKKNDTEDIHVWLGKDVVELAKKGNTMGTWVPYVRDLIGLSHIASTTITDVAADPTPITINLSALVLLFLKCSNVDTASFPCVGDDGMWRMPEIEGNRGKDEHLFYDATDEVMVTVV
jgi:hypothetical protein